MIITFILYLFSWFFQIVDFLIASMAFLLQMPYITTQFTNAMAWLLGGIFYWQGVMPVVPMLNFIGYVLGWYSTLFILNSAMYLWSKLPFIGKPTSRHY